MECALKTALFYSTVSLSLPFYLSEKNLLVIRWTIGILCDIPELYWTINIWQSIAATSAKKEREKCKKSQELFENHGNENIYFSWFLVLVGACNAFEDETDKLSMTTKTTWVWQLQRGYLILESFSHKFDFFSICLCDSDKQENAIPKGLVW